MGPHLEDLHRMAVFAQVVDDGGFSSAARTLGIAKSAVSRHVGLLETRLGVRLLNRTTRQLHLTEAGESFYQSCRLILDEAEGAVRRARDLQDEMIGTLNMTLPAAFGRRYVVPHLADLIREHPRLDLKLTLQDAYLDLVANGIDLAVRIGQLADSSLVARALAPVPVVLCASPEYLSAMGTPKTPADLEPHCIRASGCRAKLASRQWRVARSAKPPERAGQRPASAAERRGNPPDSLPFSAADALDQPIVYVLSPPSGGDHRGDWARWGEYTSLPPQRWLHNLEHGGAALLYHPCAPASEVEALRTLIAERPADFRWILTPYADLPATVAVVTWEWSYLASCVRPAEITSFIDQHYRQAPEDIAADGRYDVSWLGR
jgi:DNA-binding transcriptional LysR family regulator